MKLFVSKSVVLSLALLVCPMIAMETPVAPVAQAAEVAKEAVVAVKSSGVCAKVGEFVGSVKAQLPAMPAMPTKEEAKAMVKNAPQAAVEFAKAHPYKATAIVAATAAVAYAIYKVCTAKKAKTKVVVVK
jgi:hypothetical protein